MKATLGWIREFVDIMMDPGELAERLTHRGLECGATLEGTLEGVVVGEVLEVEFHPKADHLKLCRVRAGTEALTVLCGAPNVRQGVKAPLALMGTRLPDGTTVQPAEIRGCRSEAMLCSEAELHLGEEASGIWILPTGLTPGERLDEAMGLADWVLALDLTPNRGDCLSILGLAQEVAAIVGSKVRLPVISLQEEGAAIGDSFSVSILDPDLCPRYVARMIEGTRLAPAPLWMRRRLQLVGLRPINNLVDVTNYVMWELGQPLHAFDLDLLEGGRIVVKRAQAGERFVSLDGQERLLSGEMLMIWDGVKQVAVAGVMGGENSEVGPRTRNVLIESAHFHPINIRKTAKALGMNTEASRRFERGIDAEGCPRAADRAAQLIGQLAGGRIAPGRIDAYPRKETLQPVTLRVNKVNELLGTTLDAPQVASLLKALDLQVEENRGDLLRLLPPTRRNDLSREVDLIEEVARVWGFDRIPATLPRIAATPEVDPLDRRMEALAREVLVGFGFHEIITYAFIDQGAFDRLDLGQEDPWRRVLSLRNPLRQDQGVMRSLLLPGLLDVVRRNLHRKNLNLSLFELGRVFLPTPGEPLPLEARRLGGAITGSPTPYHWSAKRAVADVFHLKGVLEGLFESSGIREVRFEPEAKVPFLHRGNRAAILSGEESLGWMGELAPQVIENWDLEMTPLVFELDFEAMARRGSLARGFRPLPRYPEVVRDLSIVVRDVVPAGDILEAIRQSGLVWLQEAYVLDVFTEGEKVPQGHKSLTFRVRYRSDETSLTDEEVNAQHGALLLGLKKRFGARLRS